MLTAGQTAGSPGFLPCLVPRLGISVELSLVRGIVRRVDLKRLKTHYPAFFSGKDGIKSLYSSTWLLCVPAKLALGGGGGGSVRLAACAAHHFRLPEILESTLSLLWVGSGNETTVVYAEPETRGVGQYHVCTIFADSAL